MYQSMHLHIDVVEQKKFLFHFQSVWIGRVKQIGVLLQDRNEPKNLNSPIYTYESYFPNKIFIYSENEYIYIYVVGCPVHSCTRGLLCLLYYSYRYLGQNYWTRPHDLVSHVFNYSRKLYMEEQVIVSVVSTFYKLTILFYKTKSGIPFF